MTRKKNYVTGDVISRLRFSAAEDFLDFIPKCCSRFA